MNFLEKTLSYLSLLSSDPLFSTIFTLYTLILLYFPTLFLRIIFSPVLICTGITLLTLLRLGAIQRIEKQINSTEPQQQTHDSADEDHKWVSCETNLESSTETNLGFGLDQNPFYAYSFVGWNVRAPLEIIYEAYEGEEEDDENDDALNEKQEKRDLGIERYPSLSLYYPESESEVSSDGDFPLNGDWDWPESMSFKWDEEDREGLIEIALDVKSATEVFYVEEDNLIEIDISPSRNDEFPGEDC